MNLNVVKQSGFGFSFAEVGRMFAMCAQCSRSRGRCLSLYLKKFSDPKAQLNYSGLIIKSHASRGLNLLNRK